MKPLSDHDLERLLNADQDLRPPADLAARIKAEIPATLPRPLPATASRFGDGTSLRRLLPLAAMLLVALGAGWLTLRVRHDADPLTARRMDEAASSAVAAGRAQQAPAEADVATQPEAAAVPSGAASGSAGRALPPGTDSPGSGSRATGSLDTGSLDTLTTATATPDTKAPDTAALDPKPKATAAAKDDRVPKDTEVAARETRTVSADPPATPSARRPETEIDSGVDTEIVAAPALGGSQEEQLRVAMEPEPPLDVVVGVPVDSGPSQQMRPTAAVEAERTRSFRGGAPRTEPLKPRRVPMPDGWQPRPQPPPGAPYDAVTFRDYGTNPWVDTRADRLSTFGLDVDTGSFNIVRRFVTDGHLPDPAAVRVEELINAFDYGDRPPQRGDFAVHAELATSPFAGRANRHLLRFAVKAREVAAADRPPVDLVFVVDISGSMAREDRLGLVQDAGSMLLDQLRPGDRVALVTFNDSAQIALLPTSDHETVRRCLRGLVASGSTNAADGLHLGYRLAADYRRPEASSRVMLLSDGVANVGTTSAYGMLEEVAENRRAGVELTTVGVGMGNYNDVLLEQLADRGDGRYAYVDDRAEAHRLFVETLSGTLTTVAAEAKVQVDFDPEVVARYRLIGYENRAIADRDFRNDRVDAGEIGAGHVAVALYEVELEGDAARRRRADTVATLSLRYRSTAEREMIERSYPVEIGRLARRFEDASPAFQLTALVAEAGELLRRSPHARGGSLERVFRDTQRLSGRFAGDRRVADWVALLGTAARLAGEGWGDED